MPQSLSSTSLVSFLQYQDTARKESITSLCHMSKWPVLSNISTANFKLDTGNLDHDEEEPDVPDGIFNTVFFASLRFDAITNSINSVQCYNYKQPKVSK